MNERDQLNQAKEQLKQSISNVFQDLRTYGNAVANRTGAIYAEKKDDLVSKMEFARLEREMERDIKARTREHKSGIKEALRENDRLQRQERRLRFKEGVKQKTSLVFGKLGQVKNDMLAKLNPSNIDVKLRDFYEKAQIKGLEIANKGKEVYNNTAQKIDNITTQQIAKYYEYQAAKEAERIEKENDRQLREIEKQRELERKLETQERKAAMKEALREHDRLQRQERRLRFKEGVKQKTSSVFGKLGQVKNDMLAKLNPSNIDVKLRDFYEKAQIKGLEIANKGKEGYNNTTQKIDNFTTQQMAKYYEYQAAKEAERIEKENDRLQRQERRLRFKEGVKQKTSSVFGKLGQVKNDMLAKLNPSNIDVKLRDFYEKAQIKGLEIANKGKEVYNNTAQKIDNFTTQQIANYYERKEARIEAKEFKEAARRAEKEEIERIKERVRERKAAMKEALRTQEREMYENKHLENQARKQELMDSLFGSSEIQEERVSYAR